MSNNNGTNTDDIKKKLSILEQLNVLINQSLIDSQPQFKKILDKLLNFDDLIFAIFQKLSIKDKKISKFLFLSIGSFFFLSFVWLIVWAWFDFDNISYIFLFLIITDIMSIIIFSIEKKKITFLKLKYILELEKFLDKVDKDSQSEFKETFDKIKQSKGFQEMSKIADKNSKDFEVLAE
jgi:hypothetical protein